jgi:hypothetical protein
MMIFDLRKEIQSLRQDHWENCKQSEVAKDRSHAQGDPNWEKKLNTPGFTLRP